MTREYSKTTAALVPSRQRARSPQDKDLRRAQLVGAATQLFADADFDAVTIARVAARAGVAKGTAYLYFATKESLFLELVRAEMSLLLADLTQKLGPDGLQPKVGKGRSQNLAKAQTFQIPVDQGLAAKSVPAVIARSLTERLVLRRLLVLLHSVIEPKIDAATALDFKIFLRDLLQEASLLMVKKIPGLPLEKAATLMLQIHALVISLTQLAEPPPVIVQVMAQDPSLHSMHIDFESFLTQTLETLVRGSTEAV